MSELRAIVKAWQEARREAPREPLLLATVVAVAGSSYRRPGARMLIRESAWVAGSVSGGCLESDVLRRGWWRTQDGNARVVTYDSQADDGELGWGIGLGCSGVVDVLLERIAPDDPVDPLAFAQRCLDHEEAGVLVTVFRSRQPEIAVGARLALHADGRVRHTLGDRAPDVVAMLTRQAMLAAARDEGASTFRLADQSLEALIETIVPPPHLFVFGSWPDAEPVVNLGLTLGWTVSVCERHARWATRERFARAHHRRVGSPDELRAHVDAARRPCAVVMSHDYHNDRDLLAMLLRSRAIYVGALGPRRRTQHMLDELGLGPAGALPRLHAPVGLDLGAETPAEIALAIVSEIQGVVAEAPGAELRARPGAIHERAAGAAAAP